MTGWRERQETGRETIMSTAGFRTGLDWTGTRTANMLWVSSSFHGLHQLMKFSSSWILMKKAIG